MADNVNALPTLPIGATANNVPGHIDLLKNAINGGSINRRLTGAQIAALTGAAKQAGVKVYNTTTGKTQTSNGTAWVDDDAAAVAAQSAAAAAMEHAMPLGAITAYGGTTAPAGWHLCDGTAHGSAALQTLLGSANTPDLRGKFVLAASAAKPRSTTGGAETHTLTTGEMPTHSHGMDSAGSHAHGIHNGGDHAHSLDYNQDAALGGANGKRVTGAGSINNANTTTNGLHSHGMDSAGSHAHGIYNAGSGQAHNNMPPFYALTYIIKKI